LPAPAVVFGALYSWIR